MRERELSPVELVEAHLERIEALNAGLNAFVLLRADEARAEAKRAEQSLAGGEEVGPLHGVPFSCKDNIATSGDRTTCNSRLVDAVPDADATAVQRLRAAGAILLGKTNLPELAMSWDTDGHVYGRTNSAWDAAVTPGGSSGGEAAAQSAGLSPLGLGTDGGGSIRVPAHFSGITGLKGTPGRIPLTGRIPRAANIMFHLANIGPLARRVADLRLALSVLEGYDSGDAAAVPFTSPPSAMVEDLAGVRVALFAGDTRTPVDPAVVAGVRKAGRLLEAAGLVVEEAQPPGLEGVHELWYTLLVKTIAASVARAARGREHELHPCVRDFVRDDFSDIPLSSYTAAWSERDERRARLLRFMATYPVLLGPPASVVAFPHGQRVWEIDGRKVEWIEAFSVAQAFNVYGLPAATVPVTQTEHGLPVGVQVVGRPWEDELVLAVAQAIEDGVGPYRRPPERVWRPT